MKIPVFKSSKRFLQEFDLPCLVAKLKNSKLTGVAARHIAESKDDPTCVIYLRGEDPKKISSWQREILEQLFLKAGLAAAIEEALSEYGKDPNAYCSKEERREIKKYGFAPFTGFPRSWSMRSRRRSFSVEAASGASISQSTASAFTIATVTGAGMMRITSSGINKASESP
jgi:hypothetical protein